MENVLFCTKLPSNKYVARHTLTPSLLLPSFLCICWVVKYRLLLLLLQVPRDAGIVSCSRVCMCCAFARNIDTEDSLYLSCIHAKSSDSFKNLMHHFKKSFIHSFLFWCLLVRRYICFFLAACLLALPAFTTVLFLSYIHSTFFSL